MAFSALAPHPSNAAPPPIAIEAIARVSVDGSALFRFRVQGDVARIRLPRPGAKLRRDELWRHTCFEAFVRPPQAERYLELNFAPSGDWAAYSFERYRAAVEPPAIDAPTIRLQVDRRSCTLEAGLRLPVPAVRSAVGLAAVIEDLDGNLSYWALTHPRSRPDFHDAAGWTSLLECRTSTEGA